MASPRSGSWQAQMLDLRKNSLHESSNSLTIGEGRERSEQDHLPRFKLTTGTLQEHRHPYNLQASDKCAFCEAT